MVKNKKDLILVRGLPGSGKSTLGNIISDRVYSADDYFINKDNEYKFDGSKLREAHKYCEDRCRSDMLSGRDKIVICNTFTMEWEMGSYYNMAKEYGYRVHSIVVENRHNSKNIHGVGDEKVEIMRKRFNIVL
jgi:predicted kinase